MDNVQLKIYCDKTINGDNCNYLTNESKGSALFCGVAYPTPESRSDIACEKAFELATQSFLRRPSTGDAAMNTISGFINDRLYMLQEPRKEFLCDTAFLYIHHGYARVALSGNSCGYHFCNGKIVNSYRSEGIWYGRQPKWERKPDAEIPLEKVSQDFLLVSGESNVDISPEDVDRLLSGDDLESFFQGKRCFAVMIHLPERKKRFPLFGKR